MGEKNPNQPSHRELVAEFIRRGNLFLDYMNQDQENRRAVFNAPELVNAHIPVSIKDNYNDTIEKIPGGWVSKYMCTFYLEWAFLIDQKNPVAQLFTDIYDPVIKLYERGGVISYHHNELICGQYGWSRNSAFMLREHDPIDINDETLNKLDNS